MTGKSSTTIPYGSTSENEMETVALFHFYVLIDPRDGKIKYVGRTVDLKNRFRNHIYEAKKRNRNKRERWIVSLLRKNLTPVIKSIYSSRCFIEDAINIEKMLVKKLSKRFELKNQPDNFLGAVLTGKKVYMYSTENGEFLKCFSNSNQAMISTGVKDSNILRCCKSPNGYGYKTAGGYFWSYVKYDFYPHKHIKNWRELKGKAVVQYTMKEVKVDEFISARKAEKSTGVSFKKISAVCNGRQKSAGGFLWKFKQ